MSAQNDQPPRGFSCVGLVQPKNPHNIGSVLRAAHAFGAASVMVEGARYRREGTDTSAAYAVLPLLHVPNIRDVIPFDCIPVAVELTDGATSLVDYQHPARALYIFGAEDHTLGRKHLSWCRDKIYVPTAICLNLAACVNVVLFDRMAKGVRATQAPGAVDAKRGHAEATAWLRASLRDMPPEVTSISIGGLPGDPTQLVLRATIEKGSLHERYPVDPPVLTDDKAIVAARRALSALDGALADCGASFGLVLRYNEWLTAMRVDAAQSAQITPG